MSSTDQEVQTGDATLRAALERVNERWQLPGEQAEAFFADIAADIRVPVRDLADLIVRVSAVAEAAEVAG